MRSSTAAQRRYSSSTSGWSSAAASTRAITRRCSVMRMPLALHRASMSLGFGAFTTLLRATAISRQGAEIHWISSRDRCRGGSPLQRLLPITADRGGGPAHLIVRISPPDFSKTRTAIKSKRRDIALVDLEKNAARAERGEPAQMGLEQLPPQASPTPGGGDSNRQDLSLVQNEP